VVVEEKALPYQPELVEDTKPPYIAWNSESGPAVISSQIRPCTQDTKRGYYGPNAYQQSSPYAEMDISILERLVHAKD